jgi:translation elongation factor EF-Ts
MKISKAQIKELRETTGAGILDCRKTLEQTGGDMEKAVAILREKGLAAAAKRSDRETKDGVIDLYSHGNGRVGVMVEVNCETDFVARTDEFRHFVHELALQIAANAPKYLDVPDIPEQVLEEQKTVAASKDGWPSFTRMSVCCSNRISAMKTSPWGSSSNRSSPPPGRTSSSDGSHAGNWVRTRNEPQ